MVLTALPKLKLVILSLFIGLFFYLGSLFPVNAQTYEYENTQQANYLAPEVNSNVPKDQHTYVQSALIETISAVICQLVGKDMVRPDQKCLGVDPSTGKIGFVDNGGGLIGMISSSMAYTTQFPVSSKHYIDYMAGNFGVSQTAYAQEEKDLAGRCFGNEPGEGDPQGYGFCGIQPLLGIWVAMRNIAYLLFVIIFLIIGLAIMFRVHIDPRTVMTIENQIPKIIVGILLVTFSFAIAGLLIDVMYVSLYVVGGVLATIPYFPTDIGLGRIVTQASPPDVLNLLWDGGFFEVTSQGATSFYDLVGLSLRNEVSQEVGFFDFFSNVINGAVVLVLGLFAMLFIIIGLLFAMLRLWLMMILSYINILLDIVFAPFWFLIGLLPGSSAGVGAWFKDMLANLAVYPTALSMLILGKVFGELAKANKDFLFTPPLAGAAGYSGTDAFAGIIMLGFIFMTPHVIQITKGAIKAPNINYGPVFQPIGAGAGSTKAFAGTVGTFLARTPKPGDRGGPMAVLRKTIGF